jgi:2-keto-4-pentenoate hydratase/2-oxohepta-3-ene-1,7-dioic acid hydratase in catechol pathway
MRLVTFDRGGHRRLGAIFEGEVIDLPEAVGHPAFPTTLESLVSNSRGTLMDAARSDVWEARVKRAHLLTPLFPASLISPSALDVTRRVLGPEDEVPWPPDAAWLDYRPMIAAVLGHETSHVSPQEIGSNVFGYSLVNDWRASTADGAPVATAEGVPISIGPCVVTADELDLASILVQVKIDGRSFRSGSLNGAAAALFSLMAEASETAVLERGDAFALGPFGNLEDDDPDRRLWPGAEVELAAEGIGTLRNRVGARA